MSATSKIKRITTTTAVDDEDDVTNVITLGPVENAMAEVDRLLRHHARRIGELKLRGIATEDNLLAVIAHTHKELEDLHPHIDYNTRTHRLVLNRMLAEVKLPLTILENPLDVTHTTQSDWIAEIKKGQTAWLKLASGIQDAPKQWENFHKMANMMRKYQKNDIEEILGML